MSSGTVFEATLAAREAGQSGAIDVPDFETLYAEQFRYVWRCLLSLGVASAELDDAVQEVFLVVRRRLPEFDGACQVRTWLFAIVRRVALRYRTRARVEAHRVESDPKTVDAVCCETANLELDLEKKERLRLAQRALERLDESKREVFVFCVIEGLSAPEVAEILAVPVNTVYSRLRAARAEFTDAASALERPGPRSFWRLRKT